MSETGKNGERSNPPELIPVPSSEVPELFEEGAKHLASAIFWTPDQKHVVHSQITYVDPERRIFQVEKAPDFNSGEFAASLARTNDFSCIFSISLIRSNIFFKSLFAGSTETDFHFQLPERIFKVQRRKHPRFVIPDGYILKVDFEDPLDDTSRITRKVWDLSAGGLSFCVLPDEHPVYQNGLRLKEMTFTLQSTTILVDVEVRHKAPILDGSRKGEYKVGVAFTRIKPADLKLITAHVADENRKFYSRFV